MNPLSRFFTEFLPRLRGWAGTFDGEMLNGGRATLAFEGFLRGRVARAGVDPAEFTPDQWFEIADAVARSHVLSRQLNRGSGGQFFGPGIPGSGVGPNTPGNRQRYTVVVRLEGNAGAAAEVLVEVVSQQLLSRAGILQGVLTALARGETTTNPSGRDTSAMRISTWRVLSQLTV